MQMQNETAIKRKPGNLSRKASNSDRRPEGSHTTALSNENSGTNEEKYTTVYRIGDSKVINFNVASMDPHTPSPKK